MYLNKLNFAAVAALLLVAGCNTTSDTIQDNVATPDQRSVEQIMNDGSPWATTGVFLQVNGETDRSVNFIEDPDISAGTISSAQYQDGMFAFIGMEDFRTGRFNEASLVDSLESVVSDDTSPAGFSFGDFSIYKNGEGSSIRRIRNASFAPDAVIDRTVTVANSEEFGYTFTRDDGLTYYVEHLPYNEAFPDATYPDRLQVAINGFFEAMFSETDRINLVLRNSSPWATTAIYQEVNGQIDTATNLISDPDISSGTISSAQYQDGRFVFIGLSDFTTGELAQDALIDALNTNNASGFSFGDYVIVDDGTGNIVRRLTNASFAPDAVIDRRLTTVTAEEFTYSFERDGNTYHVEHKPYAQAFPSAVFPADLQTAVDGFFTRR